MAKAQYKKWLEPENLLLVQGWKRNGLKDEEIAQNMGINPRTLWRWKAEHSQLRQALKVSKEQANFLVENKLFERARAGEKTAMIFWLKNNYREKYTDSILTAEEREVNKQRSRKYKAEADIAEAKAAEYKRATKDDHSVVIINDVPKPTEEDDDD